MAFSDYSTNPDDNVLIGGINIGEGCPPGNLNNALRLLAADGKLLSNNVGGISYTPTSRTISAGGMLTGGGDMSANRTISLTAASAAETLAGTVNDKPITPSSFANMPKSFSNPGYIRLPGGFTIQWYSYRGSVSSEVAVYFPFPLAFSSVIFGGSATAYINSPSNTRDMWGQICQSTLAGCYIQLQSVGASSSADGFDAFVMGV